MFVKVTVRRGASAGTSPIASVAMLNVYPDVAVALALTRTLPVDAEPTSPKPHPSPLDVVVG